MAIEAWLAIASIRRASSVAPGVEASGVDRQGPEDLAAVEERRRHDRVDPDLRT